MQAYQAKKSIKSIYEQNDIILDQCAPEQKTFNGWHKFILLKVVKFCVTLKA